jgi:hypothetical protein
MITNRGRAGYPIRIVAALAVALLVIANGAAAQGRGRGAQGAGPGRQGGPALLRDSLPQRGPIELLLARRDSLGFTAAQVAELQRLNAALQKQNEPLVRGVVAVRRELQPFIGMHPRDMTPTQRVEFRKQAERARPLLQQIHDNNRRAMESVGQLLSAQQKRRMRMWLEGAQP